MWLYGEVKYLLGFAPIVLCRDRWWTVGVLLVRRTWFSAFSSLPLLQYYVIFIQVIGMERLVRRKINLVLMRAIVAISAVFILTYEKTRCVIDLSDLVILGHICIVSCFSLLFSHLLS